MRIVFEHWKYVIRNLWFVLPFAVIPAALMALSLNYSGIELVARNLFTGELDLTFPQLFKGLSLVRIDFPGVIFSVVAFIGVVLVTVFLLAFVEKHMRIGKRTLSGVFSQLGSQIWAVVGITLLFLAIYELRALVLAAVLFAVCAIGSKGFACFLFVVVMLIADVTFFFLISLFYLWLPCMQITSFRAYDALLYSYRLADGVRFKLVFAMLADYIPTILLIVGGSFAPRPVSVLISLLILMPVYMSFCVRMETVYFTTDKLDREDLLRSYKEL